MTTLGTIGSGLMAREVARLATAAGIEVLLSNSRGPATLTEFADDLGDLATATTPQEAVAADVVVLALPLGQLTTLTPAHLAGKLVVDLTNYYPHRDGRIAELDSNSVTCGQYVQAHLSSARTVRALSNISHVHVPQLARPAGAMDRTALPVAGDDAAARAEVSALLDRLGFDTVDTGTLAGSWRFEPDTIAYLWPYASAELTDLANLRETPAAPADAATIRRRIENAERTDQGSRSF